MGAGGYDEVMSQMAQGGSGNINWEALFAGGANSGTGGIAWGQMSDFLSQIGGTGGSTDPSEASMCSGALSAYLPWCN